MPSPYIQSYKEQNVEKNLDSDASDMFQEDLYTSYDNAEIEVKVFDDDPFCNKNDDQKSMFDIEIYESVK